MSADKARIYEFAAPGGYEIVILDDESAVSGDALWAASGIAQEGSWSPPRVRLLSDGDGGERRAWSNMPAMISGGMLAFRSGELHDLRFALSPFGEELELVCEGSDLIAFNVTAMVDALDEDLSRVSRFADGRIMSVKDYVFKREMLPDFAVFQLPQDPGVLMCTAGVAELFDQVKPSGTKLTLLWESS